MSGLVGRNLLRTGWGQGQTVGTVHVRAVSEGAGWSRFLTLKTNGAIQVNLRKTALSKEAQETAEASVTELLGTATWATGNGWQRIDEPKCGDLWNRDPELTGLLAFAEYVGKLAHLERLASRATPAPIAVAEVPAEPTSTEPVFAPVAAETVS